MRRTVTSPCVDQRRDDAREQPVQRRGVADAEVGQRVVVDATPRRTATGTGRPRGTAGPARGPSRRRRSSRTATGHQHARVGRVAPAARRPRADRPRGTPTGPAPRRPARRCGPRGRRAATSSSAAYRITTCDRSGRRRRADVAAPATGRGTLLSSALDSLMRAVIARPRREVAQKFTRSQEDDERLWVRRPRSRPVGWRGPQIDADELLRAPREEPAGGERGVGAALEREDLRFAPSA